MRRAAEPASVRAPLASLRDLDTLDPVTIRERVIRVVRDLAEGDGAVFWSLAETGGRLVVTRTHEVGVPNASRYFDGLRSIAWPNVLLDPLRPRARSVNRFEPGAASGMLRAIELTPFWGSLWVPLRADDQLRAYVYFGGRFVGSLGAGRVRGSGTFTMRDARRAETALSTMTSALLVAEAAERGDEGADLVVRSDGHIELASVPARAWLAKAGMRDRIRAVIRALERGETDAIASIALADLTWSRLHGDGEHRYLLHLVPLKALTVDRGARLSPTQRRAAEYLAAGATIVETAQAMGIAPETVRTHVRSVYERLGVASRAELATALTRGRA